MGRGEILGYRRFWGTHGGLPFVIFGKSGIFLRKTWALRGGKRPLNIFFGRRYFEEGRFPPPICEERIFY